MAATPTKGRSAVKITAVCQASAWHKNFLKCGRILRTLQPETDSFELNNFLAVYPHPPTLPPEREGGRVGGDIFPKGLSKNDKVIPYHPLKNCLEVGISQLTKGLLKNTHPHPAGGGVFQKIEIFILNYCSV